MSEQYGPETIEAPPIPGGYATIDLLHTPEGWKYGYAIRLQYVSRSSYEDWTQTGTRIAPSGGPEASRRDAIYCAAACMRLRLPTLGWDAPAHNRARAKITEWLDTIAPVQTPLPLEQHDEK